MLKFNLAGEPQISFSILHFSIFSSSFLMKLLSCEKRAQRYAEQFKIETNGASNIESYIAAKEADFELSGASNMNLKGKAGKVNYEASGASHISAKNFHSNICTIECSGASDAEVHASEVLNIDISGMSHVSYSGKPKQLNEKSSGMSVIEKE